MEGCLAGCICPSPRRSYSHHQNPRGALSFDEVFNDPVPLDAPLMVCHNNEVDWWEVEEKLQTARPADPAPGREVTPVRSVGYSRPRTRGRKRVGG